MMKMELNNKEKGFTINQVDMLRNAKRIDFELGFDNGYVDPHSNMVLEY